MVNLAREDIVTMDLKVKGKTNNLLKSAVNLKMRDKDFYFTFSQRSGESLYTSAYTFWRKT